LEEAKADVVGLWALNFLIKKVSDSINYWDTIALPDQAFTFAVSIMNLESVNL
jgi:hypothetical protein